MRYIYCDGGCLNNQTPSKRRAYGSFLITEDLYPDHDKTKVIVKRLDFGNVTNNAAEYMALKEALKYCVNDFLSRPHILSDSKLMVNQVHGVYKVNEPELKLLHDIVTRDIRLIGAKVEWVSRDIIEGVLGH